MGSEALGKIPKGRLGTTVSRKGQGGESKTDPTDGAKLEVDDEHCAECKT